MNRATVRPRQAAEPFLINPSFRTVSKESKLFRKASLEKLSSPEQLDQLMEVTTPKGWIALITIAVVLAAAIVWGFLGNLPSQVQGQGILIRGGTVLDVVTGFGGRVEEVLVTSDEIVDEGQVVARLNQAALERRIANYRIQLNSHVKQDETLSAIEERNRILSEATFEQQLESIDEAIRNYQQQIEFLRNRIENQEQLAKDGLITQATVLETRSSYFAVLQEEASARATRQNLEIERLQSERLLQQEQNHRRLQIEQTRLELEELEAQYERSTVVTSPHSGRVLQVMVDEGSIVHEGQSLLTMERTDPPLKLVAYIPPADGKKVHEGMMVNINPTTVQPEEHGHMLGEVTRVSSFPSTPQGMMRILRNEGLVTQMSAMGSPIEVLIEPITDPSTPSGFKWSSRKGPDQQVVAGTLAHASVVVEQRRPINMVIPLLKRWFLGVESPGRE